VNLVEGPIMLQWIRGLWNSWPEPNVDSRYKLADSASAVMRAAVREAQRFGHEYIGTEHVLLGILQETDGVAFAVLSRLGVDQQQVRNQAEQLIQPGAGWGANTGRMPLTPSTRRSVRYAADEASVRGESAITADHLFLGLLRESEGVAYQVLVNLGLDPEAVGIAMYATLDGQA
jgi:ATP-dependent Clp protease ATP-binding subunit ClpC